MNGCLFHIVWDIPIQIEEIVFRNGETMRTNIFLLDEDIKVGALVEAERRDLIWAIWKTLNGNEIDIRVLLTFRTNVSVGEVTVRDDKIVPVNWTVFRINVHIPTRVLKKIGIFQVGRGRSNIGYTVHFIEGG